MLYSSLNTPRGLSPSDDARTETGPSARRAGNAAPRANVARARDGNADDARAAERASAGETTDATREGRGGSGSSTRARDGEERRWLASAEGAASVAPRGVEARREGVGARGRGTRRRAIHPPLRVQLSAGAPRRDGIGDRAPRRRGSRRRGRARPRGGARRASAREANGAVSTARVAGASSRGSPRARSRTRGPRRRRADPDGGGSTDASLFPRRAHPREEEPRRGTHRCEWRPRRARTRW